MAKINGLRKPFISIKWRLVCSLLVVATMGMIAAGWSATQRYERMYWRSYFDSFTFREREFDRQIHFEGTQISMLFEQAYSLFSNRNVMNEQNQQTFMSLVWQQTLQDQAVWLKRFDKNFKEKQHWGEQQVFPDSQQALFRAYHFSMNDIRMDCNKVCVMLITIPLKLFNGELELVQIATRAHYIIERLRVGYDLEVAIVSLNESDETVFDVIEVSSDFNKVDLNALMRQSSVKDLSAMVNQPKKLTVAGQGTWMVKLNPLADVGDYDFLVLMGDVTTTNKEVDAFKLDALVIFALSLISMFAIGSLVLAKPLNRVRELSMLFPLLHRGDYSSFRKQLLQLKESSNSAFEDEIDHLHDSSMKLNNQLENYQEEMINASEKLEQAVFFDMLTNLPNRRYLSVRLNEILQERVRQQVDIALMFVDLDDFKTINDSRGHEFGDRLLVKFAKLLAIAAPQADVISRIGGDDFVLVVRVKSAQDVENSAKHIIQALAKPLELDGSFVKLSASIGVVIADVADTADELLRKSDMAMYSAKKLGKGSISYYQLDMSTRASRRYDILSDFDRALAEGELFLVAQPQYYLDTGKLRGFEMLARWEHFEDGLISPAEFILFVQDSSYAAQFGEWVVNASLKFLKSLCSSGNHEELRISINLMASQLSNRNFTQDIEMQCLRYGLSLSNIEFEITETMLMEDENGIESINELRRLGVRIAMDDFGTGYSSLSYLRDLPVDVLKIDQSFVRGLQPNTPELAIVDAIVTLSKALNLEVIAEGVETETQIRLLRQYSGIIGQGFGLSRPLSLDRARQLWNHRESTYVLDAPIYKNNLSNTI